MSIEMHLPPAVLTEQQHTTATRLILGTLELWQLSPADLELWCVAYEDGKRAGGAARQHEIDRARADADRYYRAMCARPAPASTLTGPSYADLERIRGNTDNATRVDAANTERLRFRSRR